MAPYRARFAKSVSPHGAKRAISAPADVVETRRPARDGAILDPCAKNRAGVLERAKAAQEFLRLQARFLYLSASRRGLGVAVVSLLLIT